MRGRIRETLLFPVSSHLWNEVERVNGTEYSYLLTKRRSIRDQLFRYTGSVCLIRDNRGESRKGNRVESEISEVGKQKTPTLTLSVT